MKKKNYLYSSESKEIKWLMKKDKKLSYVIKKLGVLKYSLDTDYFNFIIETIIGQMLSSKASTAISNRLNVLCDNSITPKMINKLNIEKLRKIGISSAKSKYILNFSDFILKNPDYFETINSLDDNDVINELIKMKGLGIWSAKMYLIFVLNRLDVLPYEDGAFLQSFKWLYLTNDTSKENIMKLCSVWKPYSSIASRYLYRALDEGLIKILK